MMAHITQNDAIKIFLIGAYLTFYVTSTFLGQFHIKICLHIIERKNHHVYDKILIDDTTYFNKLLNNCAIVLLLLIGLIIITRQILIEHIVLIGIK